MADARMTLEQIRARRPAVDHVRVAATTEAEVERQQVEDGEDPTAPLPAFRPTPDVASIRATLGMTQQAFSVAIGVPVATIRNWEQNRTAMDPATRSLLRVVEREPEAALRALAS